MNPKLLIVDDDEEIRTQMKWALAKDYEIVQAEDRASAVEVFRSNHPAVVLLDLGLPPNPGISPWAAAKFAPPHQPAATANAVMINRFITPPRFR